MIKTNIMTVDVEDYFHVSAFASVIRREDWDSMECRVERNTHALLDLFDSRGVRSTFFVLGWVAERYPALVREIATRGHEVACHGMTHELVYRQTPAIFEQETRRSKSLLEDAGQTEVLGYRAASYSITRQSLWALDILADLGFAYDSSIFPVRHDRYGIPGSPRHPHRMNLEGGKQLVEFPLTTYRKGRFDIPVAGGGYFRLFPYAFTRHALREVNLRDDVPFIFYLHPWEIDPGQPRIKASMLSMFRHYNNLSRCMARLESLVGDFTFDTARAVLGHLGLLTHEAVVVQSSGAVEDLANSASSR
jgi:polysaccharide deacetylase family protein (PEP-CTERM system associated)